jgi:hypothetical protein
MKLTTNDFEKLKDPCRIIENLCRSLGRDCQIIFTDEGVSIAPLSWAGDCFDKTFYDCLNQVLNRNE